MMISRQRLIFALTLTGLLCGPAATFAAAADPAIFAEGWSISRLFSGLNNQTRIIQFCVGVMVLALFIIMKKFADVKNTDADLSPKDVDSDRPQSEK